MTIDGTAIAIGITVARTVAVVEVDPATTIKLLQRVAAHSMPMRGPQVLLIGSRRSAAMALSVLRIDFAHPQGRGAHVLRAAFLQVLRQRLGGVVELQRLAEEPELPTPLRTEPLSPAARDGAPPGASAD